MQHSQQHITLYHEFIFLSWVKNVLRSIESLMIILLSAYLASLSPPSYGGITMLLRSSQTDTCK